MTKTVVFGVGQIAQIARFYLEHERRFEVVGFCVDSSHMKSELFDGLPVAAWEELEDSFPPSNVELLIPIGYAKVNAIRKGRFLEGKARGYRFITYIHPRAHYYGTQVGENVLILEANVIQPYSTIGNNVILWSGNHIGHHSHVGDHCFVSSHVVVSGNVSIGERCFLGVNATLRDNVRLGAACVVGANATVASDLPDESVVVPAESVLSRVPSSRLRSI